MVSRIAAHKWEEPPISGTHGSGTIFFTGCSLRCVFCQNRVISREGHGRLIEDEELAQSIQELQRQGVHNINFVTPTHYAARLAGFLQKEKSQIKVPVVYNCGGYEDVETLHTLSGLVDIYLPDMKYVSGELSARYSAAPDYFPVAMAALREMFLQVGRPVFDENGLMRRGMIVRHLVLPGCRADSMAVLRALREVFDPTDIRLSIMSQYTPDFAMDSPYKNLHRRVTTFEYQSVLDLAADLGFVGYSQHPSAASAAFTPDF